jgi:hypothetical protein
MAENTARDREKHTFQYCTPNFEFKPAEEAHSCLLLFLYILLRICWCTYGSVWDLQDKAKVVGPNLQKAIVNKLVPNESRSPFPPSIFLTYQ